MCGSAIFSCFYHFVWLSQKNVSQFSRSRQHHLTYSLILKIAVCYTIKTLAFCWQPNTISVWAGSVLVCALDWCFYNPSSISSCSLFFCVCLFFFSFVCLPLCVCFYIYSSFFVSFCSAAYLYFTGSCKLCRFEIKKNTDWRCLKTWYWGKYLSSQQMKWQLWS